MGKKNSAWLLLVFAWVLLILTITFWLIIGIPSSWIVLVGSSVISLVYFLYVRKRYMILPSWISSVGLCLSVIVLIGLMLMGAIYLNMK